MKPNNTNQKPKMTATIRGRVEPSIKKRLLAFGEQIDRSESYLVRKAVVDLIEREGKAA